MQFDLQAGTRALYRDPRYYDSVFDQRRADVEFYGARYQEAGSALELAVGTGRVAGPATRAGAQVVGLDLSAEMLRTAGERWPGLRRVRADMRAFAFAEPFPLITAPFNALQHLYTDADVAACLRCVREHLGPGGRFIFDVYLPDPEYLDRDPDAWQHHPPYRHPTYDAWYRYAERNHYDPTTGINQMWFRSVRQPGETRGPEVIAGELSQRYFGRAELKRLLADSGLRLTSTFGDFGGGPIRTGSESWIGVAQREGAGRAAAAESMDSGAS